LKRKSKENYIFKNSFSKIVSFMT